MLVSAGGCSAYAHSSPMANHMQPMQRTARPQIAGIGIQSNLDCNSEHLRKQAGIKGRAGAPSIEYGKHTLLNSDLSMTATRHAQASGHTWKTGSYQSTFLALPR